MYGQHEPTGPYSPFPTGTSKSISWYPRYGSSFRTSNFTPLPAGSTGHAVADAFQETVILLGGTLDEYEIIGRILLKCQLRFEVVNELDDLFSKPGLTSNIRPPIQI
jgi:hypothetical protein